MLQLVEVRKGNPNAEAFYPEEQEYEEQTFFYFQTKMEGEAAQGLKLVFWRHRENYLNRPDLENRFIGSYSLHWHDRSMSESMHPRLSLAKTLEEIPLESLAAYGIKMDDEGLYFNPELRLHLES